MLPTRRSQNTAVVHPGCSRNWTVSEIGLWFIEWPSRSVPLNLVWLPLGQNLDRLSFRCGKRALHSQPRLDHASDGPGLGGRTAREVRRLGFEDFADGAEPGIEQVIPHGAETVQRHIGIAVHAEFRQRVMAEQPGPDRPLMIGAVAVPRVASIMRLVVGVAGRKRTQPVGSQQPLAAQRDDALLLIPR